jgi:hypothetical protein
MFNILEQDYQHPSCLVNNSSPNINTTNLMPCHTPKMKSIARESDRLFSEVFGIL